MTEHPVELDGKVVICQKRLQPSEVEGQNPLTEYSFDRGETWHATMIVAYAKAKEADKLMAVGENSGTAGEFEAFVLGLIQELQLLKPGESLRLSRDQVDIIVIKEQAVLAARASTISEVDLRIGD